MIWSLVVLLPVEQVGYDPTPTDFQSAAMTTSATAPKMEMRYLQSTFLCGRKSKSSKTSLAEAVGFEPTDPLRSLVFKTSAIDRSAKPPIKIGNVGLNTNNCTLIEYRDTRAKHFTNRLWWFL